MYLIMTSHKNVLSQFTFPCIYIVLTLKVTPNNSEFCVMRRTSLIQEVRPHFKYINKYIHPLPVAVRSKAQVYGRGPAEIVSSNTTGGMDICPCEFCVLSGRGLCDELITRPEESYRLWRVVVCDLENSKEEAKAH